MLEEKLKPIAWDGFLYAVSSYADAVLCNTYMSSSLNFCIFKKVIK
jgi:hypothetical protein